MTEVQTDSMRTDSMQTREEISHTHQNTADNVTWTSEALETQHVLLRPARPDELCGMFHVPISDVAVDGLHPTDTRHAAELACGHVFHICALAVHFYTNNMRCPVCRRGPVDTARISSFAPTMHDDLSRIKIAMRTREAVDSVQEAFGVNVNLDVLFRDFLLEIYMQWAPDDSNQNNNHGTNNHPNNRDRCVRLTSPLRQAAQAVSQTATTSSNATTFITTNVTATNVTETSDHQQTNNTDHYITHRSFQRKFNMHLNEMQPGQNIICLSLTHPLMPESARSPMFDKAALRSAADAGTHIALARNIGFVMPTHTDAGFQLDLHLRTSYLSLVCVQQMLNWENQFRS
jgi:hypothetical protein